MRMAWGPTTKDGNRGALGLGQTDVADDLALWGVANDPSVFPPGDPDVADTVHAQTVKHAICGLVVHRVGGIGKELLVGAVGL